MVENDNVGDFSDYMENILHARKEESHYESMMEAQRIWREETIAGRLVSYVQAISDNDFVMTIIKSVRDNPKGDSIGIRVTKIFIKVLMVLMILCFILAIGRIVQTFIGKEIVIEKEVVIEHEVKRSELGTVNLDDFDIIEERDMPTESERRKKR